MGVPFEAVSTKPITLPCVLTPVNYGHNSSLLAGFGQKEGVSASTLRARIPLQKAQKAGHPRFLCVALILGYKRYLARLLLVVLLTQ